MNTKFWGPRAWDFLFTSILGAYPETIDKESEEHLKIKNSFKSMLVNLDNTLPCIFCRRSFTVFLQELPVEHYLDSKESLVYWLYLMKDKVNNKLLNQERIVYAEEKGKLKKQFKDANDEEYKRLKKELKNKTMCTVKTPPFQEVLDYYNQYRAGCSLKTLSCRKI